MPYMCSEEEETQVESGSETGAEFLNVPIVAEARVVGLTIVSMSDVGPPDQFTDRLKLLANCKSFLDSCCSSINIVCRRHPIVNDFVQRHENHPSRPPPNEVPLTQPIDFFEDRRDTNLQSLVSSLHGLTTHITGAARATPNHATEAAADYFKFMSQCLDCVQHHVSDPADVDGPDWNDFRTKLEESTAKLLATVEPDPQRSSVNPTASSSAQSDGVSPA